jgi:transposase
VVYRQTRRWIDAGCFEALTHDLRALLRLAAGRAPAPTAVVLDSRTVESTAESGARAGYDGHKRRQGTKTHAAVDTLGHLLALHVSPASADDRAQVGLLAAVQEATGATVELGYVDQGYTGPDPAADAAAHGLRLEVVKLPAAKKGFVLLPKRWVVETILTQLTKPRVQAAVGGRDHVADLHVAVGDHHPVDQQLDQLAALLEGGALQVLAQPGADVRHGRQDLGRVQHALPLRQDLALPGGELILAVG